jgi:Trypsin-like peptidase domain
LFFIKGIRLNEMKIKLTIFPLFLITFSVVCPIRVKAQENMKAGVVRIENTKRNEVGAGFIVKIVGDKVYVVTASHVVQGDQHPTVFLFNHQGEAMSATVIDIQEDDDGLALLRLTVNVQILSGLKEFKISATSDLGNGDDVTFIGFPGGTNLWSVDRGIIKRLEGNNLVLSGSARQGNSGGPVILNQHAIGLVTDVSQTDSYALRAEVIVPYINGFERSLVSLSDSKKPTSDEYTYGVSGWIESGRPRTRQNIDQSIQHKGYFSLSGTYLWAFDLTVTQFTNGHACNKGTVMNPATTSYGWGYPKGKTSDDAGEARPNFEFGVQQAKNSPYLTILLNPGLNCALK